jgi:hypothetical protein
LIGFWFPLCVTSTNSTPRSSTGGLKQFFENGATAFGPAPRANKQVEAHERRIAFLEAKLKKEDEVLAELMEEHVALKKSWGDLSRQWVPHDTRDQVIDFVRQWSEQTEIATQRFVRYVVFKLCSSTIPKPLSVGAPCET